MKWLYFAAERVTITPLPKVSANQATIDEIFSVVLAIAGGIALLIITISGFRYIIAKGDPSAMAQARQTILYASIGLIVSALAFTIVNVVLKGL